MGMSEQQIAQAVADFVTERSGARSAAVHSCERLSGGAIQDNFGIELTLDGGMLEGKQSLVMRTDAPSGIPGSLGRIEEHAVLQSAYEAGVKVPEPLWCCADTSVVGREFYIMRRVAGSASPRSLVQGALSDEQRHALAWNLGCEIARLHCVRPPVHRLAFLPVPQISPALVRIEEYRLHLDELPRAQPTIEWALHWLERNAPPRETVALCHGDYRTGNYMVSDATLTGILDWEFAAWSDPLEDLGWFCARSWRFGAWQREAGGMAAREAFYDGYRQITKIPLPVDQVPYWEVMATVRWAVIALQQAQRHLSGEQPSLELALTGRKVPEMELDLLMTIEQIEAGKT